MRLARAALVLLPCVLTIACSAAALAQGRVTGPNDIRAAGGLAVGDAVDGNTSTAAGSTTPRALTARFGDRMSVADIAGVDCTGATDSSPGLAAATAAMANTGRRLWVPSTCKVRLGATQVVLDGIAIEGDNGRDMGAGGYGAKGSTILLTSTTVVPFLGKRSWALRGLTFFWPAQTEAAAAAAGGVPVAYPPLIVPDATTGAIAWDFSDNQVVNAYDFLGCGTGQCSGFRMRGNLIYALHYALTFKVLSVESFVSDNHFTPFAYQDQVLGQSTHALRDWGGANSELLRVVGNGTATALTTQGSVDALEWSNNYVFGYGRGVHVSGGFLQLSDHVNLGLDGVREPVLIDSYGVISGGFVGGQWYGYQFGQAGSTAYPAVSMVNPGPGTELALTGVTIPNATGGCLSVTGGNYVGVTMTGVRCEGAGSLAGATDAYAGVKFDAVNGRLQVTGGRLGTSRAAGPGVQVVSASQVAISGVQYDGAWSNPYDTASITARQAVSGSTAIATTGTVAITGAGASVTRDVGNSWTTGTPTGFSSNPTNTVAAGATFGSALGGFNNASAVYAAAMGGANTADGMGSLATGVSANTRAQTYIRCHASGTSAAQMCDVALRGSTASTTALRLTADAAAPSVNNTVNLPPGAAYRITIEAVARDTTTNGNVATWSASGLLVRDGAGTSYTAITAPTLTGVGTGTSAALAVAADGTTGGLAVTFTAPNGNAWHATARVVAAQVL